MENPTKQVSFWQQFGQSNLARVMARMIVPFLLSRGLLILVAYFAVYFQPWPNYPDQAALARGYARSSVFLVDIWDRWDSGWYLSIVLNGYSYQGELEQTQSNLAFMPLFPMLVRALSSIKPDAGHLFIIFTGEALSNLCFYISLVLLILLGRGLGFDEESVDRAAWYLAFFPTSYYFSSFYTESLYLVLSLAVFYAAFKEKWWLAGVFGFFLSLTRMPGVAIVLPIAILYMQKIQWNWRAIRWNVLWLGLIPAGPLAYTLSLLPLTHDLLAPSRAHQAWDRGFSAPWTMLFTPVPYHPPVIYTLDRVFAVLFFVLAVVLLLRRQHKSLGVYSLLMIAAFAFTGNVLSASRLVLIIFPVFLLLGAWGKHKLIDRSILIAFAAFAALLMAAWVRFYWVA